MDPTILLNSIKTAIDELSERIDDIQQRLVIVEKHLNESIDESIDESNISSQDITQEIMKKDQSSLTSETIMHPFSFPDAQSNMHSNNYQSKPPGFIFVAILDRITKSSGVNDYYYYTGYVSNKYNIIDVLAKSNDNASILAAYCPKYIIYLAPGYESSENKFLAMLLYLHPDNNARSKKYDLYNIRQRGWHLKCYLKTANENADFIKSIKFTNKSLIPTTNEEVDRIPMDQYIDFPYEAVVTKK